MYSGYVPTFRLSYVCMKCQPFRLHEQHRYPILKLVKVKKRVFLSQLAQNPYEHWILPYIQIYYEITKMLVFFGICTITQSWITIFQSFLNRISHNTLIIAFYNPILIFPARTVNISTDISITKFLYCKKYTISAISKLCCFQNGGTQWPQNFVIFVLIIIRVKFAGKRYVRFGQKFVKVCHEWYPSNLLYNHLPEKLSFLRKLTISVNFRPSKNAKFPVFANFSVTGKHFKQT
jgi:hypothetical protein